MPAAGARRIGVFGGTFDPPHIGHLVAACNAVHVLDLDLVLFVVANEPWQKTGSRAVSPAEDRVAMVEAAVAGLAHASVSRIEIDRGGVSYTADTLRELAQQEPGAVLVLLVGSDAARQMPTWERFDEVVSRCEVAMIDRPATEPDARGPEEAAEDEAPGWVSCRVRIPLLAISSTELRRRVRVGEPLDYLVPPAVVSVIAERDLYRERPV